MSGKDSGLSDGRSSSGLSDSGLSHDRLSHNRLSDSRLRDRKLSVVLSFGLSDSSRRRPSDAAIRLTLRSNLQLERRRPAATVWRAKASL